ncbi:MAG: hypothetical protein C0469_05880 [Cyanobacteria bacterium DS2.3.42]|nr:hypothetical protein [Cyanobacteria bacterium DS2.3.42]
MSLKDVCELKATSESGIVSTLDYQKCMGSSAYRKENNIQATNSEVAAGTVPKVELTDGENLIVQLTGENAYRVQQIAGSVRNDTDESDNATSDDVDAVLASGMLDGQPLGKDLKRALQYMQDNFHDMTYEPLWMAWDTGDVSSSEILDYATREIDASESEAHRKQSLREGAQTDDQTNSLLLQPADSRQRGNQTIEEANGREFSREKGNDNVTYEVRKGDCVSRIAQDLMAHRLGRKPNAQELRSYIDSISLANGLYQNGRNPDLIQVGEALVFPPFER